MEIFSFKFLPFHLLYFHKSLQSALKNLFYCPLQTLQVEYLYQRPVASEQLKQAYILPGIIQNPYQNELYYTRYFGEIPNNPSVFVSTRPHETINNIEKLTISKFFCIIDGQEQVILSVIARGIPVCGSLSLSIAQLLGVTFQYEEKNQIKFDCAIFYCGGEVPVFYNYQQYECVTLVKGAQCPCQVHFLPQSVYNREVQEKGKMVSFKKSDIFLKKKFTERILVLKAYESASEQQISYDFYKVMSSLQASEEEEFVSQARSKYGVSLIRLQSFAQFEQKIKQIHMHYNQELGQSKICYMHYNQQFQDLILATKETKSGQNSYFKIMLSKFTNVYIQDQQAIKELQTFVTAVIPLENIQINPFDDMQLQPSTCRIKYFALSAMNQAITIELLGLDQKAHLIVFHLQTGSCVRVQQDCSISLVDELQTSLQYPFMNPQTYAGKIINFLEQTKNSQPENMMLMQDMYTFLCKNKIIGNCQPIVLAFSYCLLWIVPNPITKRMTVSLIKCLPSTPAECIFTQIHAMQRTDMVKQFQYFQDKISAQPDIVDKSIFDYNFTNMAVLDSNIHISKAQSLQYIEEEPAVPQLETPVQLTSMSSLPELMTQNIDSEENKETSSVPLVSIAQEKSAIKSPDKHDSDTHQHIFAHKRLFTIDNLIPMFTQNEIAFYNLMTSVFTKESIQSSRNVSMCQARLCQIYSKQNNILANMNILDETTKVSQCYEQHPHKKKFDQISLAIHLLLFSTNVFDQFDGAVKNVIFNTSNVLELFYQKANIQQRNLTKFLMFATEEVQHICQWINMQENELIFIIKTVFGQQLFEIIDKKYSNDATLNQLQNENPIIEFFLQKIAQNKVEPVGMTSDLMLAFMRTSNFIMTSLAMCNNKSHQLNKRMQSFYLADYIYYHYLQNQFNCIKHQIIRMSKLNVFVDYSDHKTYHPLIRQYVYNQYINQTLLKQFLDSDPIFLKCLQLTTSKEILESTRNYEELMFFEMFDQCMTYICQVANSEHNHPEKVINKSQTGSTFLSCVANDLNIINVQVQRILTQFNQYEIINTNRFQNQARALLELYENVKVKLCQGLNFYSKFESKFGAAEIPVQVRKMLLCEFDEGGLMLQSNFQCANVYNDLLDVQNQVNQNDDILFHQSTMLHYGQLRTLSELQYPYKLDGGDIVQETSKTESKQEQKLNQQQQLLDEQQMIKLYDDVKKNESQYVKDKRSTAKQERRILTQLQQSTNIVYLSKIAKFECALRISSISDAKCMTLLQNLPQYNYTVARMSSNEVCKQKSKQQILYVMPYCQPALIRMVNYCKGQKMGDYQFFYKNDQQSVDLLSGVKLQSYCEWINVIMQYSRLQEQCKFVGIKQSNDESEVGIQQIIGVIYGNVM